MQRLGQFSEFWRDTGASLRDALGVLGDAERRRVAFYLVQGTVLRATMGMEPDVIDGEDVYLSTGLRTDGDWYWREDFAHYVIKYGCAVPPEFVAHAAGYRWSPGVLGDDELKRLSDELREPGRPF